MNKAEKNKSKGILLIVISTLLIASAQFFLKKGTGLVSENIISYLNLWIILGVSFYALATVFFVLSLKLGSLSSTYPFLGLSYVWVSLISYFVFKETLTAFDIAGTASIIIGVSILGGFENE